MNLRAIFKSSQLFLLIFIVLASLVLRISYLGAIPVGLTNDEADIGYDAYSLLLTGKDQWGDYIPLTSFKGFGDFRLPLYTYLVVPSIALFDLNAFSVRLPSALLGTATVFLIYLLTRKLAGKKYSSFISFSAMVFAAFSPWAIGLSRIGIESNTAITFLLVAILFFLNLKNNKWFVFASFFFFVLTIYTYTSYTVFTPLVIIALTIYSWKDVRKAWKVVVIGIVLSSMLIAPLFVFRSAAGVRASQVSFINSQDNVGILADLNDKRGSCVERVPSLVCKLFQNKPSVFVSTLSENYLNHFSVNFLYLKGTTTQYSILPPMSLFYTIEFILLIAGLIGVFYNKSKAGMLVIALLLMSVVPDSITGSGHFSRASVMMPFVFLLEGFGAGYIWGLASRKGTIKWGGLAIFLGIYVYSLCLFLLSYFSYYPKYFSQYSQFGYEPLINKIVSLQGEYNKVYLSRFSNDTKQYIYYLFYTKYPPQNFQEKVDIDYKDENNGWVSVDRIKSINFVERIPTEQDLQKINDNDLIITHPSELPKNYKFFEEIKLKNGDVQFAFTDVNSLKSYYELMNSLNNTANE